MSVSTLPVAEIPALYWEKPMKIYEMDNGVLAEERYHVEECDREEYDRIFKFVPAIKLVNTKKDHLELENEPK